MALNDSNNDFVQLATVTIVYTLQHQSFSFQGLCNGQSRKRPTDRGGENIFGSLCGSLFKGIIQHVYNSGDGGDIEARYRGE